jgi:CheY-like chemotaxis protein
MSPVAKVRVLVVDDNPLVRDLLLRGLEPICEVIAASDGGDALLKAVDDPPGLIISDYRMPGLDGRQLYEKLRGREATRNIPFIFLASRSDIEDRLRPAVGAEDFLQKPFFVDDLVRLAKKVVDRLHLENLQRQASRPGVIQGRLEEMGAAELMQSLEMGQKSCRLSLRRGGETCEMYFAAGQCKDARLVVSATEPLGQIEGDEAVYQAVNWTEGEFEIDFSGSSDRTTTTRSTTGLLMEAMRLLDEANANKVGS